MDEIVASVLWVTRTQKTVRVKIVIVDWDRKVTNAIRRRENAIVNQVPDPLNAMNANLNITDYLPKDVRVSQIYYYICKNDK